MNINAKNLAVIIVLIAIGILVYGFRESLPIPGTSKDQAPDFNLQTYDNQNISLSNFKDKPLFIVFSGSWCGACRQEAPIIEKMHQQFKDKIYFLGVAVNDDADAAKNFAQSNNLTYPIAIGNNDVFTAYKISGVPSMFFIKEGKIVDSAVGGLPEQELKQKLDNLLE